MNRFITATLAVSIVSIVPIVYASTDSRPNSRPSVYEDSSNYDALKSQDIFSGDNNNNTQGNPHTN